MLVAAIGSATGSGVGVAGNIGNSVTFFFFSPKQHIKQTSTKDEVNGVDLQQRGKKNLLCKVFDENQTCMIQF